MITDKAGTPIVKGTVLDVWMNGMYSVVVTEINDAGILASPVGKVQRELPNVDVQAYPFKLLARDGRTIANAYCIGTAHAQEPEIPGPTQ